LARRSNIIFHDNYAEAKKAGFRACKRCKPELATEPDTQAEAVARACRLIADADADADVNVEIEDGTGSKDCRRLKLGDLAREAGLTKSHFHRVFKKVTGVTPRIYAVNVRAERMLDGVGTPELVESAALSVDDGSDGALTPGPPSGRRGLGAGKDLMAPKFQDLQFGVGSEHGVDYLHSGFPAAMTEKYTFTKKIEYTVQPWASGFVLIAATKDGVCWLEAGNSETELSLSLAHEFPLVDIEMSEWSMDMEFGEIQDGKYGMFATVMEALVRPTGKVLNIPFDIS